ncbi:hypothetical protein [Chryseobacterium binzhouense]|nr:hypothetical protein [Chryseobacterium binzhouense]
MTDNNEIHFRKANSEDRDSIWEIIQQAIDRRKRWKLPMAEWLS